MKKIIINAGKVLIDNMEDIIFWFIIGIISLLILVLFAPFSPNVNWVS